MKRWQNKGIVSRETLPPNSMFFLIRTRTDKRIRNPENATTPNARLNLRRRPQNLFCARVQLHVEDRAGLPSLSGSSGLNLHKSAKRVNRFSIQARASLPSQRSALI